MRPETMTVYELGSASGATVALVCFLALSLAVAASLYAVLVRPSTGRTVFQDEPGVRNWVAMGASTLLFALVFGAVYATVLRGFYRVELHGEEVLLHYLFPSQVVTLHRVELAQVERVAVHRGRWHLRLHTRQGVTYESALARDSAVHQTWEGLNAYLTPSGRP